AVAIVVADLFHAVAVRRYLGRGPRVWNAMADSPAWIARHPLRAGLAVILGWAATLAASALTIAALTLTWSRVSALPTIHLGPGGPVATVTTVVLFALGTLGLVAVMGLCLLVLALAAWLRRAVWQRALGGGA
ncbi:MAG TPA: hypothetical protein VFW92_06215, partial [Candidatus Limnocylindrales bacterium]|nr:hypothetical protein [Candidatus Limnocylindrales bacterium]